MEDYKRVVAEAERVGRDNNWFNRANYLSRIPKDRLINLLKVESPAMSELSNQIIAFSLMDLDRDKVGHRLRKQVKEMMDKRPYLVLHNIAQNPALDTQRDLQKILKGTFRRHPQLMGQFFNLYPQALARSAFLQQIHTQYIKAKQDVYLGTRGYTAKGSYMPDELARHISTFRFEFMGTNCIGVDRPIATVVK